MPIDIYNETLLLEVSTLFLNGIKSYPRGIWAKLASVPSSPFVLASCAGGLCLNSMPDSLWDLCSWYCWENKHLTGWKMWRHTWSWEVSASKMLSSGSHSSNLHACVSEYFPTFFFLCDIKYINLLLETDSTSVLSYWPVYPKELAHSELV